MKAALFAPQIRRCHKVDIPATLFTIQNWIGLGFFNDMQFAALRRKRRRGWTWVNWTDCEFKDAVDFCSPFPYFEV